MSIHVDIARMSLGGRRVVTANGEVIDLVSSDSDSDDEVRIVGTVPAGPASKRKDEAGASGAAADRPVPGPESAKKQRLQLQAADQSNQSKTKGLDWGGIVKAHDIFNPNNALEL